MALNAAYYSQPVHPRFLDIGEDTAGSGGGDSGGDGADGSGIRRAGLTVFPAVYNNGGVVETTAYVQTVSGAFFALFAAAGYAAESGFIANIDGRASSSTTFLTSIAPLGDPPFGTAELVNTLTFDGINNVSRYLVRLPVELFEAVYNNNGIVDGADYLGYTGDPTLGALYAAAGYAVEQGFLANKDGVAYRGDPPMSTKIALMTSTAPLGVLPFGVPELVSTLTFDGVVNVSRYLVRLSS